MPSWAVARMHARATLRPLGRVMLALLAAAAWCNLGTACDVLIAELYRHSLWYVRVDIVNPPT